MRHHCAPHPSSSHRASNDQRGEIGVSYLPTGKREIVLESDFAIVDRSFHGMSLLIKSWRQVLTLRPRLTRPLIIVGDVCKRSVNDVRSGIILHSEVAARLLHAITGQHVRDPVPHNKLKPSVDYFVVRPPSSSQYLPLPLLISYAGRLCAMPGLGGPGAFAFLWLVCRQGHDEVSYLQIEEVRLSHCAVSLLRVANKPNAGIRGEHCTDRQWQRTSQAAAARRGLRCR